jgi:hypothetical protein
MILINRAFALTLVLTLIPALAQAGEDRNQPLADDFEGITFDPKGGLFYKNNREQSAGKVEFQSRDVRFGKKSLSLTVVPLCTDADDDCSERAEVWEKKKLQLPYEQPVWYGFSMKLAAPIPTAKHRYVMAQWKRKILTGAKIPFSPFFALRMNKGKLVFTVDSDKMNVHPIGKGKRQQGCLKGETWVLDRPDEKQTRALVSKQDDMAWSNWRHYNACTTEIKAVQHTDGLPKATSGWIDFAFFIQTGASGDGRIEIFANGAHVTTVTGKIGHKGYGLGDNQYFKFGPYRAPRSDTWTVLYDRFRRGPKCTDVTDAGTCAKLVLN